VGESFSIGFCSRLNDSFELELKFVELVVWLLRRIFFCLLWFFKRLLLFSRECFFDGGVVSYQVGSRKPEKGCFEAVLKKFGVGVSECLYIDDSQKNVKAATAFGIKGLVFRSKDEFLREISGLL